MMNHFLLKLKKPSLLRSILLSFVLVSIYLFLFRDFRIYLNIIIHNSIDSTQILESLNIVKFQTRLWIYDHSSELQRIHTFRISFGYYFLLAIIGLSFLAQDRKPFLFLISIHLLFTLISIISLYIGLYSISMFLILSDVIARYIIPVCSLGLVALTPTLQKRTKESNGD